MNSELQSQIFHSLKFVSKQLPIQIDENNILNIKFYLVNTLNENKSKIYALSELPKERFSVDDRLTRGIWFQEAFGFRSESCRGCLFVTSTPVAVSATKKAVFGHVLIS